MQDTISGSFFFFFFSDVYFFGLILAGNCPGKSFLKWGIMDAFVKRLPKGDANGRDAGHSDRRASPVKGRPSKRLKRDNDTDSESEEPSALSIEDEPQKDASIAFSVEQDQRRTKDRVTDFEIALPPTEANDEAIEEYETLKSSQNNPAEENVEGKPAPLWVKGRSSIYVDAFNLALDTVLEEESSLFSNREREIFNQWRKLDYQAQYL